MKRKVVDFEWQGDWGLVQVAGELVYFYTESFDTNNPIIDIHSRSLLTKTRLEYGRDFGRSLWSYPLSGRFYYELAFLRGDFSDALGEDFTHTVGTRLLAGTEHKWNGLFDNAGLTATYIWGTDFHGWIVGVGINY